MGCGFAPILFGNMDLEARVRARIAKRLARRGAQADLASKLSTHKQGWLSRYLSGDLGMDLPTLEEIAKLWRVPLSALLGEVPLPAQSLEALAAEKLAERIAQLPPEVQREAWAAVDRTVTAMEASLRAGSASARPAEAPLGPRSAKRETGR